MAGIRVRVSDEVIRHTGIRRDDWANRPFVVRDVTRPHTPPVPCPWCGQHDVKTYHPGTPKPTPSEPNPPPSFDQDGTAMISPTIWRKLQMLHDNGGLEEVNVVEAPPAQTIVLPTPPIYAQPAAL